MTFRPYKSVTLPIHSLHDNLMPSRLRFFDNISSKISAIKAPDRESFNAFFAAEQLIAKMLAKRPYELFTCLPNTSPQVWQASPELLALVKVYEIVAQKLSTEGLLPDRHYNNPKLVDDARGKSEESRQCSVLAMHPYLLLLRDAFWELPCMGITQKLKLHDSGMYNLTDTFLNIIDKARCYMADHDKERTLVKRHHDRLSQHRGSFQTYLNSLWTQEQALIPSTWLLTYRGNAAYVQPQAENVTKEVEQLGQHLKSLLQSRSVLSPLHGLAGYCWMMLYAPGLGTHVRLLCLHTTPKKDGVATTYRDGITSETLPQFYTDLSRAWNEITANTGLVMWPEYDERTQTPPLQTAVHAHDAAGREAINQQLEYWLMIDHMLHIRPLTPRQRLMGRRQLVRRARSMASLSTEQA